VRIAIVYDCLFPWTVGGAERWERRVAEALAADGHEVTYLTRLQWDPADPPRIPGVRVIAVSRAEPLYGPDGNRTIGEPLRFGLGVLKHLARHGSDYDVVHTASFPYFSLLAAGALRRARRYRLVTDWFEVWSDDYWTEYLGPLQGRVARAIQTACVRLRQEAFCTSRLHALRLREAGLRGEPTILRGAWTGPTTRPQPLPVTAPHVVFAGRHIPEKHAPDVVPAVVAARERIPGLTATIFGDGPQLDRVREAIATHDAGAFVTAPGFVEGDAVDRALERATCLLLPSTREGYGLVVVEASSKGVPSVVVDAPDNAATELVEDGVNGFVCADGAPRTLADAVVAAHEGGDALRERTADWFARHAPDLSLEVSMRVIVARYRAESVRA
jgi:glycosyltransferase involved in cell wall biosynthesis